MQLKLSTGLQQRLFSHGVVTQPKVAATRWRGSCLGVPVVSVRLRWWHFRAGKRQAIRLCRATSPVAWVSTDGVDSVILHQKLAGKNDIKNHPSLRRFFLATYWAIFFCASLERFFCFPSERSGYRCYIVTFQRETTTSGRGTRTRWTCEEITIDMLLNATTPNISLPGTPYWAEGSGIGTRV